MANHHSGRRTTTVSDSDTCRKCGKTGHWAQDCKNPTKKEQAHLAQAEDDEPALLMVQVCALSDVLEPKPEQRVFLNELRAQVHLECEGCVVLMHILLCRPCEGDEAPPLQVGGTEPADGVPRLRGGK